MNTHEQDIDFPSVESQNKELLKILESGHTITSLEAIIHPKLRCQRLAARIKDLRDQAHEIETIMEQRGRKRYARYRLIPPTREVTSKKPQKPPKY